MNRRQIVNFPAASASNKLYSILIVANRFKGNRFFAIRTHAFVQYALIGNCHRVVTPNPTVQPNALAANRIRFLFASVKTGCHDNCEARIISLNVLKPYDAFDTIGYVGIALLLLAASVAIWKWAERYKTDLARFAAVLMIAGLWVGLGVHLGIILALMGLVLMLVARSDFKLAKRRERDD
jgi:hypothetical protein